MIDISERSESFQEDKEEYLHQHSGKKVALERIIKFEIDYIVGDSNKFGSHHITITMPSDISLSDNLVNLLEKLKQGESAVIDEMSTIRFETGFCTVE